MSVQEQVYVLDQADGAVFDAFYARYQPQVLRYAVKQFGWTDAEEITAETMSRAFAAFDTLDPGRSALPWLTVTARRIGVDLWRERRGCRDVADDVLSARPTATAGPDDLVLAAEEERLLHLALKRLNASQQRFIRLRYLDEMSYQDISALLARTEVAVRQQVCRARAKLQVEFAKLEGKASALVPVGVIVSGLRRLKDRAARALPVGAGAGVPLGLLATVVMGVGTGALLTVPGFGAADLTTATVVSASVSHVSDSTAAPRQVQHAPQHSPAASASKLVDVRQDAGPVTMMVKIGARPLAPGAHREHDVSVRTPVGTLHLAGTADNSRNRRVVCAVPGVDCG